MRLRLLQEEYGSRLRLVYKAFALRPEPDPTVAWNEHRAQGWARAAAQQPEAGTFQPWTAGKPYPQWSLPALEAAKWAAACDGDAFARFDARLFDAFFAEGQDISQPDVLAGLAAEVGLDAADLPGHLERGTYRQAVLVDFVTAISSYGINAVPAVVVPDGDLIVGAVPRSRYREAVERALAVR